MRIPAVRLVFLLFALAPTVALAQTDKEKTKQAMEKFEVGKTAYRLGDYEGAIARWSEAYKLKSDPVFLYNIAQAYREKKEFEKAISFYRNYLKEAPNAANRTTVEKRIEEMKEALEKQQQASDKPPSGPDVPGERPPTAAPKQEERRGGGLKTAGMVTGGAGVALIVTGIVFGIMSRSDKSDIEDAIMMGQPWSQELADKQSSGESKTRIANITLGAGIAAVVAGGVLYYLGIKQESSVEVRPEVSARGFGATVLVRY